MPVVMLHGLPDELPRGVDLQQLTVAIKSEIASHEELNLTPNQVSVFMPTDHRPQMGEEIVAFIEGLDMREERTPAVLGELREGLCHLLAKKLGERIGDCRLIEVIVRSQRPADGRAVRDEAYWGHMTAR